MTRYLKWHEISSDMKSQMTWNLKWHETSNDMKSQMIWNHIGHEISNDKKSQMTLNLMWHEFSNSMKSQMIWNLIWHETSIDKKSQMTWDLKRHQISNGMKSQMTLNLKLIDMCRNFLFLQMFHVQKFEISPYDRFFSTGTTRIPVTNIRYAWNLNDYDYPAQQPLFEHTPVPDNNFGY